MARYGVRVGIAKHRGGRWSWRLLACTALLSMGFGWAGDAAAGDGGRRLEVDDIFRLESIGRYYGGPFSFSPADDALAFTRVRPASQRRNHKMEFLWGNAGSDVWVQSGDGAAVNITEGVADDSGWWAPEWSPSGDYLAMLSTRDGNVRVWLWERASGRLRRLSERGVDLNISPHPRPFVWLDEHRLVFPVLPAGEQPLGMRLELQTPAIATREWPKTPAGEVATASVLDSGVPIDVDARPHGSLLLLDVATGGQKLLADAATTAWQLSPRGDAVAFARVVDIYQPRAGEPLPFGVSNTYALGLSSLGGEPIALQGELSRNIIVESLRWSPEGDQLALLGYPGESRDDAPMLYRVDLARRTVDHQGLGGLDAAAIVRQKAQLEWTADGDLLLLAATRAGDAKPDVRARRDWWLIDRDGERRNLSASLEVVPGEIWAEPGRSAFVGLAGGELWRIKPQGDGQGTWNLTASFVPAIAKLQWPVYGNAGLGQWPSPQQAYSQLVFGIADGTDSVPYLIDLDDGDIRKLAVPATGAEVKAYRSQTGSLVFHRNDGDGLFLWRGNASGGGAVTLLSANRFLSGIQVGELRPIEYDSLNGQKLKAWLLLPPGHRKGNRYPLITWVYAGYMAGPVPPMSTSIGLESSLNLQIPAAEGYAVLIPSMPLGPEGATDDPMLRLSEGVLPAVAEVVRQGLADPERLYLMGQSFGGFSTYGLVTQTDRFAAAVSLAGLSNLISLYGQFDARLRYTDHPHENFFQMALAESAQLRMGGPPWEHHLRYMRNSPIFQVDRVNTPLMMIYGDLDYVAMQQGEEFFTALHRQGKRAQLVRYWGEGHVLRSPANIRDMWARIFAWFETFPRRNGGG